ncbi:hypothetical protein GGR28_003764 [Lewinella aquimaris]|uniref:Transposase DDE domain-containing protein n=1 Tax=Neolewinella aquimaris TaxID=1835722 RepID=A0A840ECB5_9BACT|nr:IS982 family transposase [Neolewinella aquimaris]MBB4081117.1 hypothetical protein [Neolewinella aquimaris]
MLTKDKEDKLIEIFVTVDDFLKLFGRHIDRLPIPKTRFEGIMCPSEIIAIIIFYQYSGFKCFQYFYKQQVQHELREYFPRQVSYKRFLRLIKKCVPYLYVFTKWQCMQSEHTGVYFIDSKKLPVCHNRRIHNHKVFKDLAERGHTSTGWFYGFKIHLAINNLGQVMNYTFTSGNVSDAHPDTLRHVLLKLAGKCYGDKGYLSRIFEGLYLKGLKLVTKIRKNMKNKLMPLEEKYQSYKRAVIESVFDILMTVFDIDHTRHRSPQNAMAHMLAAVAAYSFMDQKPGVLMPKLLK